MRYNPAKRESYDPFDMMDDFFDHPFRSFGGNTLMRTDVTETDQAYELAIDLPGYKKENIHISLKDGTLTVSADQDHDHEERNVTAVPAAEAGMSAMMSESPIFAHLMMVVF